MKTAISIPDDVFEEAARIAARKARNRTSLCSEPIREYLATRDPEAVARQLDDVLDQVARADDRFISTIANEVLARIEW